MSRSHKPTIVNFDLGLSGLAPLPHTQKLVFRGVVCTYKFINLKMTFFAVWTKCHVYMCFHSVISTRASHRKSTDLPADVIRLCTCMTSLISHSQILSCSHGENWEKDWHHYYVTVWDSGLGFRVTLRLAKKIPQHAHCRWADTTVLNCPVNRAYQIAVRL